MMAVFPLYPLSQHLPDISPIGQEHTWKEKRISWLKYNSYGVFANYVSLLKPENLAYG